MISRVGNFEGLCLVAKISCVNLGFRHAAAAAAAAAAKSPQSCPTLCDPTDQAPLSLGFSRQEYWSGLPFAPPMHESESEVAQSCLTLSNPMDCSSPGSFVHGIFQARVLEWGAIDRECSH